MTHKAIIAEIKKGNFKPIYLLHGKESYYIDRISDTIEAAALTEEQRAFNQTIIYGKETSAKPVVDVASRYPMMAPRQLIILREAQEMKTLKDLASYAEKPVSTTVLVICHKHKKFDGRAKLTKAIQKNGLVFESKPLYDNQIADWIKTYLNDRKRQANPNALQLLAEYLGTSLSKIANELDKLLINIPKEAVIDTSHVQEHVGISKEYNVFELQKAVGQRDVLKANRIIQYFTANPRNHPMVVIVSTMYNYFNKVYQMHFLKNSSDQEKIAALELRSAYFLREYKQAARNFSHAQTVRAISTLREYDLKSKGVGNTTTPESELVKEMIYKILH